ncbi:hypothetical protein F5887DRAFT_916551 [Amanita rubescens]|nr:hypothetical protein F5887DRAFT_916551 [Amanita rubescens]
MGEGIIRCIHHEIPALEIGKYKLQAIYWPRFEVRTLATFDKRRGGECGRGGSGRGRGRDQGCGRGCEEMMAMKDQTPDWGRGSSPSFSSVSTMTAAYDSHSSGSRRRSHLPTTIRGGASSGVRTTRMTDLAEATFTNVEDAKNAWTMHRSRIVNASGMRR